MKITADLDDPVVAERVWALLQRRSACRRRKPTLYDAVVRCLDEALSAGRITAIDADLIRLELRRELHPAAVLAGNWRALIRDRPALGAFMRGPGGRD